MTTQRPSPHSRLARLAVALLCLFAVPNLHAQRSPVATRAIEALATTTAVDAGPLPVSETLTLTLRLQPSPTQAAALNQLLTDQLDRTSPSFHHWLTPAQFAASFGPTDDQISTLTRYLEANGLTVSALSPAHTRLTVTGTAGAAQMAFSTSLHRFYASATPLFANTTEPTLPTEFASIVASISGLDNLPEPASSRITISTSAPVSGPRLTTTAAAATSITASSLTTLADVIDTNTSAVLPLASNACASDLTTADIAAYRALFQQANAQGITILATSACQTAASSSPATTAPGQTSTNASFPAALPEVTALIVNARELATPTAGIEARPTWQAAPGLPADALRHEPDLTTTSIAAFAHTIATLNTETGGRLGNLNATLYQLAKTPGLYTQPDATTPAGTWQPATGLGLIDLNTLLKVYPRGLASVSLDFQSSTYSVSYGTPFTLNAIISPSTFNVAAPTGTVTFTASSQGVLGSSAVSNGIATLTPGVLPVGTYTIIATYSGDGNYAASSKGGVNVYVAIVNASLQATLSPSRSVPYGSTATATATVTLPGSSASPSGDVYAQIESVTGALYTATLSPNAGSNSATANIVLAAPSPGSYTVEVSCQGSQNFQCQTPVDLSLRTVKGYTSTTIAVNPAAPQAGQPVYITAVVANSGNAAGTYTYTGSISFYDSGKLIASAPVATNQATASVALSGTRTHDLTAVYSGDTNWNTSTSGAVSVLPTLLNDSLTVTTNTNGSTSLSGINLTLTATVSTDTNYGAGPTGYITFFDTFNGTVLELGNGSALVSNGPYAAIATFTTTGLQPGLHNIYAQYTGSDDYAAAVSGVIILSISDFNVTMNPTTLTLSQGKGAQVNALIGATGGFAGTVTLGCTPPGSSEASCTISPSSVSVGGSSTITITTTAPRAGASSQRAGNIGGWTCATGITFATLVFFAAPRRRSLASLVALLFAVGLTANLGCAIGSTTTSGSGDSGSGGSTSDPGTPLGTQNFTITAAGSDGVNTVRHTYQYQVTVQ